MIPYMSYTVYFIDSVWKLRSRHCLLTLFLPEDHTGDNNAEAMKLTLGSWDLDSSKQVCLTTDNGNNIVRAAQQLN